jgi:acyl-coenzyme A thioesterase PaaI-like protein
MTGKSVQETVAPHNACFGCGPANPEGLHIRSFEEEGEFLARWTGETRYEAFPGMLNGGILGTLLDCHSNWCAAMHLMRKARAESPPCTVTAAFSVKLLKPTPSDRELLIRARVTESGDDRAVVEASIEADGTVYDTCRGTFVAVKPGHPAYHRW